MGFSGPPSNLPEGSYWVATNSSWVPTGSITQLQGTWSGATHNTSWVTALNPQLPHPYVYYGLDAQKSTATAQTGDFYLASDSSAIYRWASSSWGTSNLAAFNTACNRYLTAQPYTAIAPFPYITGMPVGTFLDQYSVVY
jgi:hypothetical protein